jgi:subtilisin family serine protease
VRLMNVFILAGLLVCAGAAAAGEIHPNLQLLLDRADETEAVSVIVHLEDQAMVPQISSDLTERGATRAHRHREVVLALQAAAETAQAPLLVDLDERRRDGGVFGYTSYWITNCVVMSATKGEIERVAARPDVSMVEPNFTVSLIEPVSSGGGAGYDPDLEMGEQADRDIGITPGLYAIRAPEVWEQYGYNGAGRLIGSLDTGVDGSHPALTARWRGNVHPWQECWLDVLDNGTTFPVDNNGHGTHTTGTMTGVAPGDTVGVAWGAQWIAANAIDQGVSSGFDNDVIACFQWFADPDGDPFSVDDVPDVVQNSWGINEGFPGGYTDCDDRWWAVIDNCEAAGVVTTWSAGNEGPGGQSLRSPADRATTPYNCFSVGAVNATSYDWPYPIASFSSRGPSGCLGVPPENLIKPEVTAPGVDVYSSVPGGGYSGSYSGTSMAGPHVAGIVALLRQANPDLEVDTIKQILMLSARDAGDPGEDNTHGHGFVDALAAVELAVQGFGRLEGYVNNASYQDVPIPGAEVSLADRGFSFASDETGFYSGLAAAAVYDVTVSAAGFADYMTTVEIFSDQTTTLDFALTDVAGPQISEVSDPVSTSDQTGPYPITAEAVDYSTVASVTLHYWTGSGAWQSVPMVFDGERYGAEIPGQPAHTRIDFYVAAEDGIGLTSTYPAGAPQEVLSLYITEEVYAYAMEDPGDEAWQLGVPSDQADAGLWIRAEPVGTEYGGQVIQPDEDHTPAPGIQCFVTGNANPGDSAGTNDVDHGCTTLVSPFFDLSGATRAFVTYWRWFGEGGNSTDDDFVVEVSADGGATWVELERVPDLANAWHRVAVDLADLVVLSDQVQFRFLACDDNTQGLVEAAIDDFTVETFVAQTTAIPGEGDAPVRPLFALGQNHPNPFNPQTTIAFAVAEAGPVELTVFAVDGRKVATLLARPLPAGTHQVTWNGRDDAGRQVASGTYVYRLQAGHQVAMKRMVLVK